MEKKTAKHLRNNNDDLLRQGGEKGSKREEINRLVGWICHNYVVDPEGIERREIVDNNNNVKFRYHIREEDIIETPIKGILGIQDEKEKGLKKGLSINEEENSEKELTEEEIDNKIEELVALDTGTSKCTHKHGEEGNRYCIRSWKIKPVFFNTAGGLARSDRMGKYIIPSLDNVMYNAYIIEGGMDLISPFIIQKNSRKGNNNWVTICDDENPRMENTITGEILPLKIINNIPYLDLVKRYKFKMEMMAAQRMKKNSSKQEELQGKAKEIKNDIANLEFFNKFKSEEAEMKELITFILEEIKKSKIKEEINIQEEEKVEEEEIRINTENTDNDEYNPYKGKEVHECTCNSKNHLPGDSSKCMACLLGKMKSQKTKRMYRKAFNKPQLEYLKKKFIKILDETIGNYKSDIEENKKQRKFGENLSIDVTFSSDVSARGEVGAYTIKDKATQWIEAYPIKKWPSGKLSVEVLRKFLAGTQDLNVSSVRSDNGAEFKKEFTRFIEEELNATHVTGLPYAPETEMDHESIHAVMNSNMRSMIVQSQLPVDLWG